MSLVRHWLNKLWALHTLEYIANILLKKRKKRKTKLFMYGYENISRINVGEKANGGTE